jgi:signal transduction histidine kinase
VVVTDLVLLYVLQLNEVVSISLAIAIAGWIYFPLRQWLLSRILKTGQDNFYTLFPRLIDLVFDPRGDVGITERWAELLQQVFQPQSLQRIAIAGDAAAVSKAGLHLIVPDVGGLNKPGQQHSLELAYADGGTRLFSEEDAKLAQAMWALLSQAMVAQKAFLRGTLAERERIYRDLHDGLGGIATNISLLSELAQQETSPAVVKQKLATISALSREGLDEIRGFMRNLDDADADWQSVIADMRVNGRNMLEPHGIEFKIDAKLQENLPGPDSVLRLNLFRIYKEALVNVIKHAKAKCVTVRIEITKLQMQLEIADDGMGCTQSQLLAEKNKQNGASATSGGRGLPNLRTRAHALGGTLAVVAEKGTRLKLIVPLPIKYPEQGMAG